MWLMWNRKHGTEPTAGVYADVLLDNGLGLLPEEPSKSKLLINNIVFKMTDPNIPTR
jgi:hypothetical protein